MVNGGSGGSMEMWQVHSQSSVSRINFHRQGCIQIPRAGRKGDPRVPYGIGLPGHAVYAGSKSAVSQTDFGEKRCTVTQLLRLYAVTTTNRHLAGNSEPKDATHGKDLIRPHSRSSYYLARPAWIACRVLNSDCCSILLPCVPSNGLNGRNARAAALEFCRSSGDT